MSNRRTRGQRLMHSLYMLKQTMLLTFIIHVLTTLKRISIMWLLRSPPPQKQTNPKQNKKLKQRKQQFSLSEQKQTQTLWNLYSLFIYYICSALPWVAVRCDVILHMSVCVLPDWKQPCFSHVSISYLVLSHICWIYS